MQNIVGSLKAELRSAWRYRWHALAVAWAVCMLGWLAVYLTPDTYEARARFYLDTSSALAPFVKELSVGMDVDQQVDLVRQVVLGRDAMLNVARETDLALQATTPDEMEGLLEKLQSQILLTGGGRHVLIRASATGISRSPTVIPIASAQCRSCRSCWTASSRTR